MRNFTHGLLHSFRQCIIINFWFFAHKPLTLISIFSSFFPTLLLFGVHARAWCLDGTMSQKEEVPNATKQICFKIVSVLFLEKM